MIFRILIKRMKRGCCIPPFNPFPDLDNRRRRPNPWDEFGYPYPRRPYF